MTARDSLEGLDWIAADWGTSRLRVWALARDGGLLAKAASEEGMGRLTPEDYEPALLRLVGDWLPERPARPLPVLVCGMAGARQGWREAAYRGVPCRPLAAGATTPVPCRDPRLAVAIVPGLSQARPPDVMRGEETQLAGLLARLGEAEATACLPGTHSKWVRLSGGKVRSFATYMTGELFSLLAEQSVLRHSVAAEGEASAAFLGAVKAMLAGRESLSGGLFSIRAASLLEGTPPAAGRARLSGLLIGAELAATRAAWEGRRVHLVGAGPLAAAYATALRAAGAAPVEEDAEALTLAGLREARALLEPVPA